MDYDEESSMDGSLNDTNTSGTPAEPAVFIGSPSDSIFNMDFQDFGNTTKTSQSAPQHAHGHVLDAFDDYAEIVSEEYQQGQDLSSSSYQLSNSRDPASVIADVLPQCNKISSFLSEHGFPSVNLISSDVDAETQTISTFVVDSWAQNVLSALLELQERVQSQRQTLSNVSTSSMKNEAGQEALLEKMKELRSKLQANEQREKAALLKIKMLEEGQERKNKLSGADNSESKRVLKNMETQMQELERRGRTKDLEIERLKQKLAHIAEKERDNNARNRTIISQIKSGDMSFISDKAVSPQKANAANNTSFQSAAGKSVAGSRVSSGSGVSKPSSPGAAFVTATTVVSLTAVVDALESQRKELATRNKELELQVRDLLLSLKKAQNAAQDAQNAAGSRGRHGGPGNWDDHNEDAGQQGHHAHDNHHSNRHNISSNNNSRSNRQGVNNQQQMNPTAQSMYQRIQQQEGEIEGLLRQLDLNSALLAERDETITAHRLRGQELHAEIETLRLQLESRPTMRQWTQAQRDREQLEERLHDLILLRGEAAEISMWRKHLTTTDRIKVDKRNHELGLWLLDSLPKATMKEVLQTVCRELDISEISEIQPSLAKLKAVVKSVPRMERFITQVCGFIYQRHPTLGDIDGMHSVSGAALPTVGHDGRETYTMDHIIPILRRWWYAAQRCVELDAFHDRILLELYRRQEVLARKQDLATAVGAALPRNPQHLRTNTELNLLKQLWESEGKHQWACKDPEKIFEIVRDLVDFQAEVMHHDQSLVLAEDYIRERPEILVNRIVGHIQYLFEIKSLDGVLPRLNQVYIFVEEMRNFMSTMRAMLQVKPGVAGEASNTMLLAEIQRRLLASSAPSTIAGGLGTTS